MTSRLLLSPEHTWTFEPWHDPRAEASGVPITLEPADPVEHYWGLFWLPLVGPTCALLAPRLVGLIGEEADAAYLSSSLGLGLPKGQHCALANALRRLEQFKIIRRPSESVIEVRTHARPLSESEHGRLHPRLAAAHISWLHMLKNRRAI